MLVLVLLSAAGCAASATAVDQDEPAHENLNATLWVQTSAEYRAAALQAYDAAQDALERALADKQWTASLEQQVDGGYADLAPAVVLDVDETVLDNSPYQARLIQDDESYTLETWNAWALQGAAEAVPGALEFTRYAAERGVAVIYLTNRRHSTEEATRRNLRELGFPVADGSDYVLTRGERPEWDSSDKTNRRRAVARRHRVLLLVGDNLGDFLSDVDISIEARAEMVSAHREFWGQRWILLPNPQYGSWEGALFNFDYDLTPAERLERKRARLREPQTP